MVERIARSLCAAWGVNPDERIRKPIGVQRSFPSDIQPEIPTIAQWERFTPHAHAALNAMRDPTNAVMAVPTKSIEYDNCEILGMLIDAALIDAP